MVAAYSARNLRCPVTLHWENGEGTTEETREKGSTHAGLFWYRTSIILECLPSGMGLKTDFLLFLVVADVGESVDIETKL